jgi:hypothetical protein
LEICECGRWVTTIWFPALLKARRSSRARERSELETSVQQRWRRGIFGSSSFTWEIFRWIEKHESLVCSLYSTTKDLQMTKSAHSIEWHDWHLQSIELLFHAQTNPNSWEIYDQNGRTWYWTLILLYGWSWLNDDFCFTAKVFVWKHVLK